MVGRGAARFAQSFEFERGRFLKVHRYRPARASHPPVALVHGFMGSADAWGSHPARLARDREVLVPDLPGHGGSASPADDEGWSIARVAAALGRAVASIAEGEVDWVGYSMGGRILIAGLAEESCVARRVVLESTSPGLREAEARERRRRLDEERARTLERDGVESFVDAWMAQPLFASQRRLPAPVRSLERTRRQRQDARGLARCLRGGGAGRQPSYWEALPAIRVPALVLTGALDPKFEAIGDAMVRLLPHAQRRSVADAGHAVHLERSEAWFVAVRAWLSGGEPE